MIYRIQRVLKRVSMGRLGWLLLLAGAILVLSVVLPGPFPAAADQGLKVIGGLIEREVSPGEILSHTFTVSNSSTGAELEIQIEARGFGQGLDGSYVPLEAAEDRSPCSARGFITAIEPSTFTLGSGESREVTATIQLPFDPLDGTRYALIYIHTDELSARPGSAIVLAATVPVVLSPRGVQAIETGTITELAVGEVESGRPIAIQTTFANTGNRHYRAYNEVTLSNLSGKEIGFSFTGPTASSILPGFACRFDVGIIPGEDLPGGTYTVESRVFREDGGLLSQKDTRFTVSHPWEIFPPRIVPESIEIFTFNGEDPPEISAVRASLRILFRDTGKVTGRAITARYDGEPWVRVPFSLPEGEGGMNAEGIGFLAVHLEGFRQGTAEVQFLYSDEVLQQFDEASLFIAYWDGNRWERFEDVRVYTGARYVSGEVSAERLIGAPVGLGGKRLVRAVPSPQAEKGGPAISLWVGLAVVGGAAALAAIGFWTLRRRWGNRSP